MIRRPNPLTHSLSKGTHHELQRVQQEMDDEAATLRLRKLRGGYIPDPGIGALIASAAIGAGLGLAWALFCLWLQSC